MDLGRPGRADAAPARRPPRPAPPWRRPAGAGRPRRTRTARWRRRGPGRAEDAHRGDVLEHEPAGVHRAGLRRRGRCRPPGRRARPARRPAPAARPRSRRRSPRPSAGRAGRRGPGARRTPSAGRTPATARSRPSRCTSAPWAAAIMRREQADRAGPSTSSRSPGARRGGPDRPQRVAARLDQRAQRVVDGVRQREQSRDRHRQPLGQRARPAVADADLVPVGAQVLAPGAAPVAVPAAEHGVAGDPPPDPARGRRPRPRRHRAAPLVPDPHRVPAPGRRAGRPSRRRRTPRRCRTRRPAPRRRRPAPRWRPGLALPAPRPCLAR